MGLFVLKHEVYVKPWLLVFELEACRHTLGCDGGGWVLPVQGSFVSLK